MQTKVEREVTEHTLHHRTGLGDGVCWDDDLPSSGRLK